MREGGTEGPAPRVCSAMNQSYLTPRRCTPQATRSSEVCSSCGVLLSMKRFYARARVKTGCRSPTQSRRDRGRWMSVGVSFQRTNSEKQLAGPAAITDLQSFALTPCAVGTTLWA